MRTWSPIVFAARTAHSFSRLCVFRDLRFYEPGSFPTPARIYVFASARSFWAMRFKSPPAAPKPMLGGVFLFLFFSGRVLAASRTSPTILVQLSPFPQRRGPPSDPKDWAFSSPLSGLRAGLGSSGTIFQATLYFQAGTLTTPLFRARRPLSVPFFPPKPFSVALSLPPHSVCGEFGFHQSAPTGYLLSATAAQSTSVQWADRYAHPAPPFFRRRRLYYGPCVI